MDIRLPTDLEKEFLIQNYPHKGPKYCAAELKISLNRTKTLAAYLNLKVTKETRSKMISDSKKNKVFSEEQLQFIKDNYSEYGLEYCVNTLNLKPKQVESLARKFKLYRRKKRDIEYPLYSEYVLNIDDPIKAYCLGLLWTDGHVRETTITQTTTEPDASYYYDKLMHMGKWGITRYKNPKHPTWKERVSFQTTNPFLCEKLKDLNFMNKTYGFQKIYEIIPEEFKRFFIIGVIDGDGCIFINEKAGNYQVTVCSCYEQDWDCFTNILESLNIKFTIERTQRSSGSYSKVHINGKYEVMKFGKFIYSSYEEDKIGLPRKYDKYLKILSKCKEEIPENWYQSKR